VNSHFQRVVIQLGATYGSSERTAFETSDSVSTGPPDCAGSGWGSGSGFQRRRESVRRLRPDAAACGRTGSAYADWIMKREQGWRDRITLAALDPFRGCATSTTRCVRSGCCCGAASKP